MFEKKRAVGYRRALRLMEDGWYLIASHGTLPPHVTHDRLRQLEWVTTKGFDQLIAHRDVRQSKRRHGVTIYRFHWV